VQLCFGGHWNAFIKVGRRHSPNRSLLLNLHTKIAKLLGCFTRLIEREYLKIYVCGLAHAVWMGGLISHL
jgi:hypothetical protein